MPSPSPTRFLLAALAPGAGDALGPIHVQKLAFLAEKALPKPVFRFVPHHYGPADPSLFRRLRRLCWHGFLQRTRPHGRMHDAWHLTRKGLAAATAALDDLPLEIQAYLRELYAYATALGAAALVGSVVRQYPETATEMVFFTKPQATPGPNR